MIILIVVGVVGVVGVVVVVVIVVVVVVVVAVVVVIVIVHSNTTRRSARCPVGEHHMLKKHHVDNHWKLHFCN